ncbi:MAG: cell envelope biogenesis protein OmpA [Saprospiraceae bacterium]|nr:MAG: cell envelope biogenesis protein OmpA [Saprospiraceae bacterium]
MNKKLSFLLSILILIGAAMSCNFTQKVRDGKTAFDRKQYAVAAKMLKKEYAKSKTRIEKGKIAFMLAESYKATNQSDAAIDWYEIAFNNQYGIDALKEYAYGLKKAERYEEAIRAFKDLGIEIGSPYEYRREIRACEIASGWKDIKTPEYNITLSDFNSGFADYAPTLYKNNQLVITSDRNSSTGDDTYNWTGNAFSDLFLVDLNTNSVASFSTGINTKDNEGTVAFNQDYSEVIFTRCYGDKREDSHCKLMASKSTGDSWSVPEVLPFVEENVNYGHPSLSKDGNSLYFACQHPDGWGGFDIYEVNRDPSGQWGEPSLMSRSINTPGNEKFPNIDGDTLYFASDFHPGMGGLDIFKTYRLSNGSWSPVYNLKPPINSGSDDFGYVIDYQAKKGADILQVGYFTSTRDQGLGNDDIYRFEKIVPPPAPVEEPKEIVYKMNLDGYVLEKIYEESGNPNSRVLGRKPLDAATVVIRFGNQKKEVTVSDDGYFTLELDEATDYDFVASKEEYLNNRARFSTKGIGKDPNNPEMRYEVEIVLDKIFLDREIRLENIYYDFDEWFIREDAKPTLNELTENLKLNPSIRIQLSSHTDCRGNPRYNEQLSQKRAQSAVDYLISKGIDPVRLEAVGYGENQLEIDCVCTRCTEEEHQANRRTTFKILDKG